MLKFSDKDFNGYCRCRPFPGAEANQLEWDGVHYPTCAAIAVADIAKKKFDEWLAKQQKAYSTVPNNSLWMKCSRGNVPSTYKYSCYLIPVEEK